MFKILTQRIPFRQSTKLPIHHAERKMESRGQTKNPKKELKITRKIIITKIVTDLFLQNQ